MMEMSMGMGMCQRMETRQEMRLVVARPNWSLVKAYEEEGDKPLRFKKKQLDLSEMSLQKRLEAIDKENEVFRFVYARNENEDSGRKGLCYKIPLLRDYNVDEDDIKIRIPKEEYEKAAAILKGAGRFQRIARSVPYSQLYKDINEFVEANGSSLEDTVIVSVDRGGRLPSYIVREALGKEESYSLKVDQAGFGNGSLDEDKLVELINEGVLKDRFVLFVDSTVDSGRQIEVLKKYFDGEWRERIGCKDWGVVGSNENGENLYKHRNINWGLDPDESFEDDPRLMGIDYAEGSRVKVVECPCEISEKIKEALLEVPRGVVLDISNIEELLELERVYSKVDDITGSGIWDRARYWDDTNGKELGDVPEVPERKKLLIIGDSSGADITDNAARYIAHSLSPYYNALAGTSAGNPGKMLEAFNEARQGSGELYNREDEQNFRENLVRDVDAVLALGGNKGTLTEAMLALCFKKPVCMIEGHGTIGAYAVMSNKFRNDPYLCLEKDLKRTVKRLQNYARLK